MYRTNNCGELRIADVDKVVTLSGWVQRTRKMGGMVFVDLRDHYALVAVPANKAKDILSLISKFKIKNKRVRITLTEI